MLPETMGEAPTKPGSGFHSTRLSLPSLPLLLLLCCASEGASSSVLVQLVARDGEDPFEGAATARVTLEADEPIAFDPVPIDPAGEFEVDVDLSDAQAGAVRRARLEASDADGEIVSRGSTPLAPIGALAGFTIRLLVSPPESAGSVTIPDLPPLRRAVPLLDQWILGLDGAGDLAMLDLLTYLPVRGMTPLDPVGPEARLVELGEGKVLLLGGGEDALVFDGAANGITTAEDGLEGASWRSPTVAAVPGGGALALCDGADDLVVWDGQGAVLWDASLAADREGCAAVAVGNRLVVYGGGSGDSPSAELVDLESRDVAILSARSDRRRGSAAVARGERVFVLGGIDPDTGSPLGDGVRLDPSCDDGCPEPFALGAPRASPVAIATEDEVLVAGDGTAELIDLGSLATRPVALPEAGEIAAGLLVSSGDVWLLGARAPIVYAP
ncbi:MAG: hypothetical protein HYY06_21660 [Deltaproteobacteria bacterium]|nr:hypothetical protein [Deltaproteobacteria bacterium]